jgi:diguanylate cyclase (GGDEF)-like protein
MKKSHLSRSISLFVLIGVLLLVGILGIYFDRFLKDNASEDMQKRMMHGYDRLASDLKGFEKELKKGIAFSQHDKYLRSSIDLVNNYQDKQNYNAILLDEEKKNIARQILNRVKLSLNDDIALYDKDGELIAFVKKEERGYRLNFFSYDAGRKILYSKLEDELEYKKTPYQEDVLIPFNHKLYYSPIIASGITTNHLYDHTFCIKSHQNITTAKNKMISAHIEMSRCLGESYFKTLSNIMDMQMMLSQDSRYEKDAFVLFPQKGFEKLNIFQQEEYSYAVAKLDTVDKVAYFVAKMNASLLNRVLVKNREQLLVMLFFITLVVLAVLQIFVNNRLTLPLQQLMGQINKIEQSDYTTTSSVKTGDELETISHNINQLAETINQRESQLKASKKSLEFLSLHDPLTDLPNRRFFMSRLDHAIDSAKRNHTKLAVMFLDIDQFKHLNDTLGHDKGDKLLKKVSSRLAQTLRSADTLARIGGDEFNILIENIDHLEEVETIVEKLLENFDESYLCEVGEAINITASVGIAMYPDDGEDAVTLIKHADMAMYQSKGERNGYYRFFSQKLADYVQKRVLRVNALKAAISSGEEFVLQYQPQVSLSTNEIVGIEALVRWENTTVGPLRVDEFVELAEETNFIIPLGKWIAQKACSDFVTLLECGCDFKHVSINVSSKQLHSDDLVKMMQEIIEETHIDPKAIEIEITETFATQYKERILQALDRLRKMDIGLAVDDFGTGYSSMSYLQKLPVTRLKIDKSFLENVPGSEENEAIIKASIALAKTFKLSITAEGVENEAQKEYLEALGCDVGQGFYYAKPLDLESLKSYYKQHTA